MTIYSGGQGGGGENQETGLVLLTKKSYELLIHMCKKPFYIISTLLSKYKLELNTDKLNK